MAALRPCPSGLTAPASSNLRLRSWPTRNMLPLGRSHKGNTMFVLLKIRNYTHGIPAHKGPADEPVNLDPEDNTGMPFREEMDRIDGYMTKICDTSILDLEATALSRYVCTVARIAVELASEVMNSADLRAGKSSEISPQTIKQTVAMYVCNFVSIAEDSYHKKVRPETIDSFIGALQGMAAISHILVQDTLTNHILIDTKDKPSSCRIDYDVDKAQLEHQKKMNDLRHAFTTTKWWADAYKILWPTLSDAVGHTKSFVRLMIANRERELGHVHDGTK